MDLSLSPPEEERCAQMRLEIEGARALVYDAAWRSSTIHNRPR